MIYPLRPRQGGLQGIWCFQSPHGGSIALHHAYSLAGQFVFQLFFFLEQDKEKEALLRLIQFNLIIYGHYVSLMKFNL